MSDNIIEVEDVTIRFNLVKNKVKSFKEYVIRLVKGELKFTEFFALKQISFNVKKGEAWAIVGNNGSGKTTLLKTIAGILTPYQGKVRINGTVAALIDLSSGLDMELTARENIYLNGAILGYDKKYIDECFDEIVEFSELGEFLDAKVRNFSSGMKSRLSFSIATAIKPEILIIDEALSVGDINFRKKSKAKIKEMLSSGVTLLFVSHNLATVKEICSNAIWLDKGEVKDIGEVNKVCSNYQKNCK